MKPGRLMALALVVAMLFLSMTPALSLAEVLNIDNSVDLAISTGEEGNVLDNLDLSALDLNDLQIVGDVVGQAKDVCVVSFDARGGAPVPEAQHVGVGGYATKPADPALEGYTFAGWYWNDSDFFAGYPDKQVPISGDMCLVAVWKPVKQSKAEAEQTVEIETPVEDQGQSDRSGQKETPAEAAHEDIEVVLDQGTDGAKTDAVSDLAPNDVSNALAVELDGMNGAGMADGGYEDSVSGMGAADNDALFEAYVNRALGGMRSNEPTTYGRDALSDASLEGSLKLYDVLKVKIGNVADGQITSTQFTFTDKDLGIENHWWTQEDLGLDNIDKDTQDCRLALKEAEGFNLAKTMDALIHDHPYDLYWFDRNLGVWFSFKTQYRKEDGVVKALHISSVTCSLYVNPDYAKSGRDGTFNVGAMPNRVRQAVANINDIIKDNADKDDYGRLEAYLKAICKLADYDKDMEGSGDPGDIKQLIYVFDGDSKTKAVCQGYSRAYKYLCDRSDFKGDVECEMMGSYRKTAQAGGTYMWNVVKMSDGRYYLADVAHCDNNGNQSTFMKGVEGNAGGPFRIDNLTYYIDGDYARIYGDHSPWLSYSNYDYGRDYSLLTEAKRGTMTASVEEGKAAKTANPGDKVTLTLKPAPGCLFAKPVVRRGSETIQISKVDQSTWTFTMPKGQVRAEVDFPSPVGGLHAIVVPEDIVGGKIAVSVNGTEGAITAVKGDRVALTCTADKGYSEKAPNVTCAAGEIKLTQSQDSVWSFTMPDDDVIVDPFFQASDDWRDLKEQIENARNGSVIKLTRDVIATEGDTGLEIPENKRITLDLNGHVINRNLTAPVIDGYAIKVMGMLTLKDSSSKQTGTIKNAYNTLSGGGICVMPDASLTFESGKIVNCKSAMDGGGISVFRATCVINGGMINKCQGNNGGGIICSAGALTINGGTFSQNEAATSGGGVYNYYGNLKLKGGSFKGNSAADYGGGVYWRSEEHPLTIYGKPNFSDNKANTGAGVWATGTDVTIKGGTYGKNTAKVKGGAIYVASTDFKLAGGTFKENKASRGGGLFSASPKTTITRGSFSKNTGGETGGGIYVEGNTLKVQGCTLKGNNSKRGAGIYSKATTTTISRITAKDNVSSAEGGGLYIASDTFKMTGGTLSGNKAARGGGVYLIGNTGEIKNGKITANSATDGGGGIFARGTKFTLSGGTISKNKAKDGGGLYTKADDTRIKGGTLKENIAKINGGGVCAVARNLTMSKGTVTGNKASKFGAGIFLNVTAAKLSGGTIAKNTSQSNGAGVYVIDGMFTVTGGQVTGNTSKANGGGVGLDQNGEMTVSASAYIRDNKGKSGADDVYIGLTRVINVVGRLGSKAQIGVLGGPHVFTKGLGKNGNIGAFIHNDADNYKISFNSSKTEAEIVNK